MRCWGLREHRAWGCRDSPPSPDPGELTPKGKRERGLGDSPGQTGEQSAGEGLEQRTGCRGLGGESQLRDALCRDTFNFVCLFLLFELLQGKEFLALGDGRDWGSIHMHLGRATASKVETDEPERRAAARSHPQELGRELGWGGHTRVLCL